MNENHPRQSLQAWLRESWKDAGCPSPGELLEAVEGHQPEAARQRLEAHTASCPACAAEIEMAATFAAGPAEIAEHSAEVDPIVAQLEETFGAEPEKSAATGPTSSVIDFPSPPGRFPRLARLAAAAVLVVGLGFVLQTLRPGPPALPEGGPGVVVRGATIQGLVPSGDLPEAPSALSWEAVDDAELYAVAITTVDDLVLWETSTGAAGVSIPHEIQVRMTAGSVYRWKVEALDAQGRQLARSGALEFQLIPSPAGPGLE